LNQNHGIVRYLEFLVARDGDADPLRHRLSKREAFFDNLAQRPVSSYALIDRPTYFRNMARRYPEPGLEPRMLWILATAKANQAERFGVGLAELLGRVNADDPARVHVVLQETYHTRMLADVVAMFGLPVSARPPRAFVRLMIHLMVSAPERWTLPLVGASEMVGCVLFRALRDKGVELFADEPAVAERIRLLYNEILADEIGHVGFIAARLDERGRSMTRRLYARLSSTLASQFSEIDALFGSSEMARRFSAFHLADEAAELPTLAFAAAQI
jgi:hypothetical protein